MPKPVLPSTPDPSSLDFGAQLFFIQGDYKQALSLFKQQLAITPQNENLLIWSSVAAYHAGIGDDYASLTIAAYEHYPSTMTAYNLGVFALAQEDYEKTLQLAQLAFDHQTGQYGKDLAFILMAHAYMGLGDAVAAEDAILTVEQSEKLPLDIQKEMAFLMGQIEMQNGNYGAASVYFGGLRNDKTLGSSAWNELGLSKVAQELTPEALECFQRAFNADPKDDTPLMNIINTHLAEDNEALAIPYIEYLVGKDPNDPGLLETLAISYRRCGDRAAAEYCLRRGLAIDPESMSLRTQLAIVLLQEGRFTDESIGLTNAALAHATDTNDDGMAYRALGSVFGYAAQAGQKDLAQQAMLNASRLLRSIGKGRSVPPFNPLVLGA